jgi:hypothetical protein
MGPWIPLDAIYTAAPQDEDPDREDRFGRPEIADMFGEPGDGTLGPGLEPETFDAAILAGLVTP